MVAALTLIEPVSTSAAVPHAKGSPLLTPSHRLSIEALNSEMCGLFPSGIYCDRESLADLL
jgi:hypothetical protein